MHALGKRTKFVVLCEYTQNEYETITRSLEATTANALFNFRFSLETLMRFDSTMSPRQVNFTQKSAESLPIRWIVLHFHKQVMPYSFVRLFAHIHMHTYARYQYHFFIVHTSLTIPSLDFYSMLGHAKK